MGGFSQSEELEAGVEFAGVTSEAGASEWLPDQLHLRLARSDLPRLQQLSQWVLHTRETSEMGAQAEQMGRSLTD